jgi:predicted XRE-type DNA-binding protein
MKIGSTTGKSGASRKVDITPSRGNFFEDLGLPDAEDRLLKAQLAQRIQELIEQKQMTQSEIVPVLGLDQSKVSNLRRWKLSGFSVERLFGILNRLGHNIEVHISAEECVPGEAHIMVVA